MAVSITKHQWLFDSSLRKTLYKNCTEKCCLFRETLTPKECLDKIFKHVPQLEKYYNLYQLLLFHLQEKNIEQFLGLIQEALPQLNHPFKIVLTTVSAQ